MSNGKLPGLERISHSQHSRFFKCNLAGVCSCSSFKRFESNVTQCHLVRSVSWGQALCSVFSQMITALKVLKSLSIIAPNSNVMSRAVLVRTALDMLKLIPLSMDIISLLSQKDIYKYKSNYLGTLNILLCYLIS